MTPVRVHVCVHTRYILHVKIAVFWDVKVLRLVAIRKRYRRTCLRLHCLLVYASIVYSDDIFLLDKNSQNFSYLLNSDDKLRHMTSYMSDLPT